MMLAAVAGAVELTAKEKELLERTPAQYREEVYPPELARAFDVHRVGCPVCGDAINKHGRFAWIIDYHKPFKVQCPECKTIFPDNDFEAYWKSGFKDKSLLTGKYVDDGRGWRPAPGEPKYWFVAHYVHQRIWKDSPFLRLAEAYTRTGDKEFARRSAAMIDKYAEYYRYYDHNKQSRYAEEVYSEYTGRIVNMIWETFLTSRFADAYNAILPFLNEPDAELQELTGKTNEEIKENIKENMFRVMANDIMSRNGRNEGNYGMHQKGLLKIAKILKDQDMVKWVTDFNKIPALKYAPLEYALFTNLFGDGAPLESPGYNALWLENISEMFLLLKENGVDEVAKYPSIRHLFTYPERLMLCGKYSHSSGDSGTMRSRSIFCGSVNLRRRLFRASPTPLNAWYYLISSNYSKAVADEVKDIVPAKMGYNSTLLGACGWASLQNGNIKAPTAAVLSYTNYISHTHSDKLHFEIFAENAPLMADFGYPDSASSDDKERAGIYMNTVSHNTVIVDATRQKHGFARTRRFDTGDFAQMVSAEVDGVYNDVSQYRRDILTCEVAPGKTIFFDVFRVTGGKQHDLFMHSCGDTIESTIEFTVQEGGTLAGKDVPYGVFYDEPQLENLTGNERDYNVYRGSGYQYLTNVRKASVPANQSISFPITNRDNFVSNPGTVLKVHMLDAEKELFISTGLPPRTQKNPQQHVMYMTRRRTGEKNLKSAFATIYEASSDTSRELDAESVTSIDAGEGTSAAKLTFKNGSILYVFAAENTADFICDDIHFTGEAGALLLNTAASGKAYVAGKGNIVKEDAILVSSEDAFTTHIAKVNIDAETLELDAPIPAQFTGKTLIANKNYAYIADEINGNVLKLRDQSPIRGRVRITEYTDDTHNSGKVFPPPVLAQSGMALFNGPAKENFDGKILSINSNATELKGTNNLQLNSDYWISECAPGDLVVFPSSACTSFGE